MHTEAILVHHTIFNLGICILSKKELMLVILTVCKLDSCSFVTTFVQSFRNRINWSFSICPINKVKAMGDDFVLIQTCDVLEVLNTVRLVASVHLLNFVRQVQLFVLF